MNALMTNPDAQAALQRGLAMQGLAVDMQRLQQSRASLLPPAAAAVADGPPAGTIFAILVLRKPFIFLRVPCKRAQSALYTLVLCICECLKSCLAVNVSHAQFFFLFCTNWSTCQLVAMHMCSMYLVM